MTPDKEFSTPEERLRDKTIETSLALWGALLTVNSVFISAFSIIGIFIKKVDLFSLALIGSSLVIGIVSMFLLILNFASIKNMYITIGQLVTDPDTDLSDEKRKKDVQNAHKQYILIIRRELIVKWFVILEGVLIVTIFIKQAVIVS